MPATDAAPATTEAEPPEPAPSDANPVAELLAIAYRGRGLDGWLDGTHVVVARRNENAAVHARRPIETSLEAAVHQCARAVLAAEMPRP